MNIQSGAIKVSEILSKIPFEVEQVRKAYNLAAEAHAGQKRASGEDYVNHVVEVATLLAQFKLDTASLVSALIHDVVEDTSVTLTDIEEEFGYEVGQIVDGVTKIGKVEFRSAPDDHLRASPDRRMIPSSGRYTGSSGCW